MAKIIEFKTKEHKVEAAGATRLLQMADDVDAVILRYLGNTDMDPREVIGVLSHRLGSLMKHLEEKDELWYVCQKVLKSQAQID